MKRALPFLFYMFYFSSLVFIQPYTVVYLQGLGFNGAQIGILAGMMPIIFMLSAPLWTGLADAHNRHKLIMSITIIITVLTAAAFPLVKSFSGIIPVVILYALFAAPIISFADSATMEMLAEDRSIYGRIRLGGTLGWGLVAPIAGLIIQAYGIQWAFWGYSAILLVTLVISQKFSFSQKTKQEKVSVDFRQLLTDKRWVLFLVMAFVSGVALTMINNFLFPYMDELKIDKTTQGLALTISTISELPILFFANLLLKRFKAHGLLILAMAVTTLRLFLYGIFNFQSGILVFQLLNGMCFPLFWVAGVSYADELAPEGLKSTAQGLLGGMVSGFGAAAGGLAGGLLLGGVGGQVLYLSTGGFLLASLVVILLVERGQRVVQLGRVD